MKKRCQILSLVFVSMFFVVLFSGCQPKSGVENVERNNQFSDGRLVVDMEVPICQQVPGDVVGKALGMEIINTDSVVGNITNSCKYFTDDTNYIGIRLNRLNYENQKSGQSGIDDIKIETDSSIDAEHFIVLPPVNEVVNIIVKVDENLILTVENGLSTQYSRVQVIGVASAVVNHLQNSSLSEDNPNDLADENEVSVNSDAKKLIDDFFDDLSKQDIQNALAKMDADIDTKQAWGVNFNTIASLKKVKMEAVYQNEWSETRQIYKAQLEVELKPNSQDFGWQNGVNNRWVAVERNSSGQWMIHELANNP